MTMQKDWKKIIYRSNTPRLIIEFMILYVILPVLVMFDILHVPLLLILLIMGISVHLFLYYNPSFDRKNFYNWQKGKKEIPRLLLLFIPAAALMVVLIWQIDSSKLFYMVRTNPMFLLMISIFYPVFSVVPQGLAYRSLFFHRYSDLFPGKLLKIIVSATIFSFSHIVYRNPLVLILTFIAGLIFAYRYFKTDSLLISVLEHSLYGVWLFTCGLGYYFVKSFVS